MFADIRTQVINLIQAVYHYIKSMPIKTFSLVNEHEICLFLPLIELTLS